MKYASYIYKEVTELVTAKCAQR